MVTLAMLRTNRTRAAVRNNVDVLVDVGAEEEHRVEAVLALERVVAVAGIPLEDIVLGSHERTVVAVVAEEEVVAGTAEECVGALRAEERVVACAAVDRQLDDACRQGGCRHAVVAAQRVDDECVVGPLGIGDVDPRRQPEHGDRRPRAEDVDDVVAVGAVDDDDVGLTVAGRPADRSGLIDVELDEVGAGEVVDGGLVGVPQRVEVDRLDAVEVHDDGAQVPGEPDTPAVGGSRELLGPGGAVEQHRVGVVLALDCVAPVPGVPLEDVVAGTQEGDVVALLPVDEVVAAAAEQLVDPVGAEDRVVPRSPVHRDLDQRGQVAGGREAVVAAVGVEDELLGGADVDRERRRVEPVEPDTRAVGRRGEHLGPAAAVDVDGVAAGTALVEVGVVTGVPDHPVVATLAEDLVVGVASGQGVVLAPTEQEVEPALSEHGVVAGLAEELVAARPTREGVVACAAEQVGPRQCTVGLTDRDRVVAALGEDLNQRGVRDGRCAAGDVHRPAVDEDLARRIAADRDLVVERITENAQRAGTGLERRRHRRARRACHEERSGTQHGQGEQSARRAPPVVVTSCVHLNSKPGARVGQEGTNTDAQRDAKEGGLAPVLGFG